MDEIDKGIKMTKYYNLYDKGFAGHMVEFTIDDKPLKIYTYNDKYGYFTLIDAKLSDITDDILYRIRDFVYDIHLYIHTLPEEEE